MQLRHLSPGHIPSIMRTANAILWIVFDRPKFMRLVMSQASDKNAMLKGNYHDADNDTRCSEDSDIRHREIVVNFSNSLEPADHSLQIPSLFSRLILR
jgi:hypothetical protein